MSGTASAVVFAYHNVGVRCLSTLIDAGIDVRLVLTHRDDPGEEIWFDSVAALAAQHRLQCIAPEDANTDDVLASVRAADADFLFCFYYRRMLGAPLLALPRRGAFNLHGSLLPKYRGRAPVNWAILCGERETGATLHAMDVKPDHGAIVDQCAVPILVDDTARQVFDKVTLAAEIVMWRALPRLIDATARLTPQRHLPGHYFRGRRPEDGRMPAAAQARALHDLVRAVAPPEYPGAFFDSGGHRIVIARTQLAADTPPLPRERFALRASDGDLWIDAADGRCLRVLSAMLDGQSLDAARLRALSPTACLGPED
jgi:methionyl-tRNA formyltransferase